RPDLGASHQPGKRRLSRDPLVPGGGRRGADVHFLTHTNPPVSGARGGAATAGDPPSLWLPGAALRELADDVDVGLVDDERPGQRRLPAAEDVPVVLVQPQ